MKKLFVIILLLFFSLVGFAQNAVNDKPLTTQQVSSLTTLGELWGFLKYYHPNVAKGQQDWDSALIAKIPLYLQATTKEAISRLTAGWLHELGMVAPCPTCYQQVPDSLAYNLDFTWINEHTFTNKVITQLNYIKANRNIDSTYYVQYDTRNKFLVSFIHEKPYNEPAFKYPVAAYRLLLLFRYWNIVNYFSPYKYLNGKDWKQVLAEKIPAFYEAKDALTYQLEYVKLVNSLNDGHSTIHGSVLGTFLGTNYVVPFLCMLIDDRFVVSSLLNDSAAAAIRIQKGDVLEEVNGKNVLQQYKQLAQYVIASNNDSRAMGFIHQALFRGSNGRFVIKKSRAGKLITDTIQLHQQAIPEVIAVKPWKIIDDSIGYVDMGSLFVKQVAGMMKELEATKAIIFDIRNYPHDTWPVIAGYLCKAPFVMQRLSYADLDYPGVFINAAPRKIGRVNEHPYSGKIVLLVDESSVSHAEYSAMGLQAATHTVTIGNTTAGKDGDITYLFQLPGGFISRFSGLGIYYPDGTITQRKGVKIDIKVRPTIKGLQQGRDEVLERAIHYLRVE